MDDKLWTSNMKKVCRKLYVFCTMLASVCQSQKSFQIKFQDSGNLSNSEWVKFNKAIPHLKDFTECHWERLKLFNMKAHSIWNYCTLMSKNRSMDCTQLWYNRDLINVGRNIELGIKLRGKVGYVHMAPLPIPIPPLHMAPFLHRSWNFFCWSYHSKSGENKLYLNGKLQGVIQFDAGVEINGSSEVLDSSFSIAQEPDAFLGSLT